MEMELKSVHVRMIKMMMVKVERWVLSLGLSMRLGLSIIYQMTGLIPESEHGT